MKLRKVAAVILVCSMLAGQTIWAAEPQETLQEEVELKEDVVSPIIKTEDETEEYIPSEQEEAMNVEKEDIPQMSEEETENVQVQTAESEGQSDGQELTLYTNYDRFIDIECGYNPSVSYTRYEVQVEDETICGVEIYDKNNSNLVVKFQPLKPGRTQVKLYELEETDFSVCYSVEVKELPDDAVPFEDIELRSVVASDLKIDQNKDGYVSFSEFENVTNLYFYRQRKVKNISGLEYATHLKSLDLRDNSELTNIDVLLNLQDLEKIELAGTGVSDEDRWKLADLKDFEINKGEYWDVPRFGVFRETVGEDVHFSMNALENGELVKLDTPEYTAYSDYGFQALNPGKVRLKATYKDTYSTEIVVTIHGIDSNQEVGKAYTNQTEFVYEAYCPNKSGSSSSGMAILMSNGDLLTTYPEVKLVKSNVKECIIDYIYAGKSVYIPVTYILDRENVLWNGEEAIATDVQKFDAHYVLDSKGVLKDLYNKDTKPVENVKDWVIALNYETGPDGESGNEIVTVYVLKNDGTMWSRKEVSSEEKSNPFVKTAEGIVEVQQLGCVSEDGNLYHYNDYETPVITGIKKFVEDCSYPLGNRGLYYGLDGCLYGDGGQRIGMIDAKICFPVGAGDCILSRKGELYVYTDEGELIKVDSGIKEIESGFYLVPGTVPNRDDVCICEKEDGSYCYYTMGKEGIQKGEYSEQNPGVVATSLRSDLIYKSSEEDCIVKKGNVEILNHVKRIWFDHDKEFALRTDGTIWDITGVPKMVLDLETNTYVPGDVNEDGVVNIEDLRIVLRGVCGKIDLTERQIQIADVETDNQVDIQDLRKILRFVCGKIMEL